jgi:hypothetical protein
MNSLHICRCYQEMVGKKNKLEQNYHTEALTVPAHIALAMVDRRCLEE